MKKQIQFYYNPRSRGRIVHWMLEEVGASYEIINLDWSKGDHKSPEYLKINPMGKIPSIVHNGVVVTETAAICCYLADQFPESKMAPSTSDSKRGSYYRWLFFIASCLEPAMFDKTHPRVPAPEASYQGHGSYELVLNTLEDAIRNSYLLGDQFTTADLLLSSNLEWYMFNKIILPNDVFKNYVKKCSDRDSFKRYMEKAGTFEI